MYIKNSDTKIYDFFNNDLVNNFYNDSKSILQALSGGFYAPETTIEKIAKRNKYDKTEIKKQSQSRIKKLSEKYYNNLDKKKIKDDIQKKLFQKNNKNPFLYLYDAEHNFKNINNKKKVESQEIYYSQQLANIRALIDSFFGTSQIIGNKITTISDEKLYKNEDTLILILSNNRLYNSPTETEYNSLYSQRNDLKNNGFAFFISPKFSKHKNFL